MRYLTSDTHFGHINICGPDGFVEGRNHFLSVEDMNQTIISNWNNKIESNDIVIHAGDLAVNMKPAEIFEVLKQLNGNIIIIPGNHDSMSKTIKYIRAHNYDYNSIPKFSIVEVGMRIRYEKKIYNITHYPLGLGDQRPNIRNFCGHIHENPAYGANVLNIGIDSPEIEELNVAFGEPIPFEDAVRLVEAKWQKWLIENPSERLK